MLQKGLVIDFWEHTNKVLLDSNLFLLFFVGVIDHNLIIYFKRLRMFIGKESETLKILFNLLEPYRDLITLPNILTEVNSLANQADKISKERFFEYLAKYLGGGIKRLELEEKYIESKQIVIEKKFLNLYLTDTAILKVMEEGNIGTITMDLDLYLELSKRNFPVLNFNHLVPWLK